MLLWKASAKLESGALASHVVDARRVLQGELQIMTDTNLPRCLFLASGVARYGPEHGIECMRKVSRRRLCHLVIRL